DLFRLTRHFLERAGRSDARPTFPYMLALAHYDWPYNVRELESAVKLSLALCDGPELDLPHLPAQIQAALEGHGNTAPPPPRPAPAPQAAPAASPAKKSRSKAPPEAVLRELLERHQGNIAAVGRELGKERMQVHRWLKRYDIDVEHYRS
ncbi:MAG TPA: Fis family transcriptional regulator, partial [Polyangiaceae bacterium LLY-WYZ-15_(1-7)]|nr:Fis family transcriptional regulator [Polyangiaceae bacterium LLY-WYZ-15_(1-7)]